MRWRVAGAVWAAVGGGWCWRWAYDRLGAEAPAARPVLAVVALLVVLAVGYLGGRWSHVDGSAAPAPVRYVVVRFGAGGSGGWCELSHCPMGASGHPDEESAHRASDALPTWMQPHVFEVERQR